MEKKVFSPKVHTYTHTDEMFAVFELDTSIIN